MIESYYASVMAPLKKIQIIYKMKNISRNPYEAITAKTDLLFGQCGSCVNLSGFCFPVVVTWPYKYGQKVQ